MAFLIPENIASRSDLPRSLQTVARAFRDGLSESITVWLEEDQQGHLLVVFDPIAGIAVVDVVAGRGGRKFGIGLSKGPADAVDLDERVEALKSGLTKRVDTAEVAVVGLLAFPTSSETSARQRANGHRFLAQDDLTAENVSAALANSLDGGRLPPASETVVRSIIKPDIVISELVPQESGQLTFRVPELDAEEVIRVLDRKQERLARDIGSGYRVIRGVAGSGKTLVLTFRARFLAENFPNMEILLTCFNVVLAGSLEAATSDLTNIKVRRVDQIVVKLAGVPKGRTQRDWDEVRSQALAIQLRSKKFRYDAVLVDEAQDLNHDQLGLLYATLDSDSDSFLVALDGAQSIYRRTASWNPPGLTARGRTRILRVNYRNTREILEFAYELLTDGKTVRGSTIHSFKGLEFSRVLLLGANSLPNNDVESGAWRRLLYVAMTRAMDELFVTVSGSGPAGERLVRLSQNPVSRLEVRAPVPEDDLDASALRDDRDASEPDVIVPTPQKEEEPSTSADADVEVEAVPSEGVDKGKKTSKPRQPVISEIMCANCDVANQSAEINNPLLPNQCAECGLELTGRCGVCRRFIGETQCDVGGLTDSLSLTPHLILQAKRLHFSSAELQRILSTSPTRNGPESLIHIAPGGWVTRPDTSQGIERLGR